MVSSSFPAPGTGESTLTLVRGGVATPAEIANAFDLPGRVTAVDPLGNGLVNDTFLVGCEAGERFVLQRINCTVFPRPDWVMANIARLGHHCEGLPWPQADRPRRWELPRLVPPRLSEAGTPGRPWLERQGEVWRLLTYVPESVCRDTVHDPEHAAEVGRALGGFHRLIHDIPCEQLHDTLEGFHVTPSYLAAYDRLCAALPRPEDPAERRCSAFIEARRDLVPVLEQAREGGRLTLRPIHGDPKVNNVLLDRRSGQAVALIDLDTVKPGLLHYDIGDCLRSGCNPAGEETRDPEAVHFELELARPMLAGYLELTGPILSRYDIEHIVDAVRLISFELGLRFYSDHLAGNRYFRIRHPGHNLRRALVQFRLTASIEAQQKQLEKLVRELT
jgi:Ser/Thr protein kinase RdoA (MazF antagonist)